MDKIFTEEVDSNSDVDESFENVVTGITVLRIKSTEDNFEGNSEVDDDNDNEDDDDENNGGGGGGDCDDDNNNDDALSVKNDTDDITASEYCEVSTNAPRLVESRDAAGKETVSFVVTVVILSVTERKVTGIVGCNDNGDGRDL